MRWFSILIELILSCAYDCENYSTRLLVSMRTGDFVNDRGIMVGGVDNLTWGVTSYC